MGAAGIRWWPLFFRQFRHICRQFPPHPTFERVLVCSYVFHKVGFISYYLTFMRLKHAKHVKHMGQSLSLIRVRSHWLMAVFP